jgi:hypothetical protein
VIKFETMTYIALFIGFALLWTSCGATASTDHETVFGLKLGEPIQLPDCQQRSPMLREAPVERACVDRSSKHVLLEHARLAPVVDIQSVLIYLPQGDLPGWVRPATVPSLPWLPGPSLIATVVDGTTAEFFFEGQPSLCQTGYQAFLGKYGTPSFTSNQSEKAEWTTNTTFSSVECNRPIKNAPTRYSTHYKVRLVAPFRDAELKVFNAEQRRLQESGRSNRKF